MATHVLLADPSLMFRDAVHALLDRSGGFEVVDAVADGRAALDAILERQPDLVIAEIELPQLGGADLARCARQEDSPSRFLFLTQRAGSREVGAAFEAGASGCLCKTDPASELISAVETIRAGGTHVSPRLVGHLVELAVDANSDRSPQGDLTRREREILLLVAEGLSSREIGQRLDLSTRTVETHRSNLMDKLDIHKVPGLVRYAIREGLMTP